MKEDNEENIYGPEDAPGLRQTVAQVRVMPPRVMPPRDMPPLRRGEVRFIDDAPVPRAPVPRAPVPRASVSRKKNTLPLIQCMSNRNKSAELFGINRKNVQLNKDRLEHLEEMVRALTEGVAQTITASEGGREDAVGLTEGLHKAINKMGDVIRSTRQHKVLGIFDMILLFYYTLFTLMRLAAETIFFMGMNMSNYIYALPFIAWLLIPFIWILMGALYLILYHTSLFVGTFGQLHRTGNEYLLWELLIGYGAKLLYLIGKNIMNIKGVYRPFIERGYNIVRREFNLSNQPFRNGIGSAGSYLKAESAEYAAEAGSFLKNKTGEFVDSATQHISSAVVDVTNKTVTAAIEKISQAPINIASGLASGVQDLGGSIASGAASGVQSLGASIVSGASVGYSGAQSLGSSIASGAASGAQSLGSSIASGASVGYSGAQSLGSSIASGAASGAQSLGSSIASGASVGAAKAGETAGKAGKAALGASKAALGAAADWAKGKLGGAINGSMLVSFKELDDIHILNGSQLNAFNESRLGVLLTDIKSEMDVILIENLNQLTDKPINRKQINYLDNIIALCMNKAAPYFIKEIELSIPFYEYVKKHKIKFNDKYKSGLTKALCNVDIVSVCKSITALKKRCKTRRIKSS